jgi:glycosyltransferase involved in cell wall biosynthesis
MLTTTILVPTYQRPKDLFRCLEAIKQQTQSTDELIVVVRSTDTETWEFLDDYDATPLPLRIVTVERPGQIAAMNAGLRAASSDIVAFTDDDAAPYPDWLERIKQYFEQQDDLGGVGGRDIIQLESVDLTETKPIVGRLQWYGRVIGEHHRGAGQAREVDVLKGVNMSFRRTAIANYFFDERLLGTGAQVHNEIAFCLALKRRGWKLLYDPEIVVDHYLAQRFDEDQRNQFNETAFFNEVHNETLALLEHFSLTQKLVFLVWSSLIGTRRAFGLIQWLRFLPHEGTLASQKWLVSMRGRYYAWLTWYQSRRQRTFTGLPL